MNTVNDVPKEPLLQHFRIDTEVWQQELFNLLTAYEDLAHQIVIACPRSPERTILLRRLLDSRDQVKRAYQAT